MGSKFTFITVLFNLASGATRKQEIDFLVDSTLDPMEINRRAINYGEKLAKTNNTELVSVGVPVIPSWA